MLDTKEINDALERVLKSATFRKASTTRVLLMFLVKSTIDNKEISATTIGLELFGKKYDPEKSDVNIRVNVSHLRKRLKQYYTEEGANDPIVISIEPGQYNATFTASLMDERKKSNKRILMASFIILVALLGALLLFLPKKNNPIWTPMFDDGLETTLFLGDVFGYRGPTIFGNPGWHRDSRINSTDEFYARAKKEPEEFAKYMPGKYSYVVFDNSYNIKPFTQYFTNKDYDFSLRPTADFTVRSIKDQNTIFAGPMYVQTVFTELFNNFSNNLVLKENDTQENQFSLYYSSIEKQQESFSLTSKSIDGEYAIASAFNGPNNSRHYLFFSNHGMGLTAVVEHFTNDEAIQDFSDSYLSKSDEFIAVFYVQGKDRTSISMEMVLFDDNQ